MKKTIYLAVLRSIIIACMLFVVQSATAQTNPTTQSLPYTQNFGTSTFTSMPTGMAAWTVNSSPIGTQSAAETSTDNGNAIVTAATTAQTTGDVYGYSASSNGMAYIQTSSNTTNGTSQIVAAVNTTSNTNIVVAYDIIMIQAQPRTIGIELQYRIGTSGSWTAVTGTSYVHGSSDRSDGNTDSYSVTLPSGANNNSVVQLRWITWRSTSAGNSSGAAIDNISVTGTSASSLIYRSVQNGKWSQLETWQTSTDSSTWSASTTIPDYHSKTITIQSGDTVTIDSSTTIDQTIVSGTLIYGNYSGSTITINNGPATDLIVNGTYEDVGPNSNTWSSGATWSMGSSGTLLRTQGTSSDSWRDAYQGGISNIPATSYWILWKNSSSTPFMSSTSAMYYPNLILKNTYTSTYNAVGNSGFTGSSDYPRIKGSLDVGGTGTNSVLFTDSNTNATPVPASGKITVRSGSELRIAGTGITAQADVEVDGILQYGTSNGRTLTFDGNIGQNLDGTGTINAYNLTVNEGATTDTVYMLQTTNVANNLAVSEGALECQKQLEGNTSGIFSMSSGTSLLLGIHASTTDILFPNKFTSAHISLNTASTVAYQANINQTISDSATFGNLVLSTGSSSTTKKLEGATAVDGNLTVNTNTTLDCQIYQLSGTSTGTFTMATSSFLLLGTTASSTSVSFPSGFTGPHTTLNVNSTVTYQANTGSQNISVTPTYGNLIVSSGSSLSKTLAGTPLAIAGNLTVNSPVNLSTASNTINLTGNATIGGTLSFSSGALNIAGNFSNNGTFTDGTSTVTFNGSSGQTIGGSLSTTFYNLTITGGSSETVNLGDNQIIAHTLSITAATLDATTSNYNLTIGGNFSNSGGTFNPRNNTVYMNSSSSQTLGGSSIIAFYKLVIGPNGTTTLGGNITTVSDITIDSTATLTASTYGITTAGNFIADGTFNAGTGLVYFNNNGHQCVSGPMTTSTVSFYNVTISGLTTVGTTCIVDVTGKIIIVPGGRMDCSCP